MSSIIVSNLSGPKLAYQILSRVIQWNTQCLRISSAPQLVGRSVGRSVGQSSVSRQSSVSQSVSQSVRNLRLNLRQIIHNIALFDLLIQRV